MLAVVNDSEAGGKAESSNSEAKRKAESTNSDDGGKAELSNSAPEEPGETRSVDWRTPIIDYLKNPSQKTERAIRRLAFKYTLMDAELYRRTDRKSVV